MFDGVIFTDFTLRSVFMANSHLIGKGDIGKVCRPGGGVCSAAQNIRSGELEYTARWQMSQYRVSGNNGHRS
jgi:hypothetical protein